jgi:hypothetical protein
MLFAASDWNVTLHDAAGQEENRHKTGSITVVNKSAEHERGHQKSSAGRTVRRELARCRQPRLGES